MCVLVVWSCSQERSCKVVVCKVNVSDFDFEISGWATKTEMQERGRAASELMPGRISVGFFYVGLEIKQCRGE